MTYSMLAWQIALALLFSLSLQAAVKLPSVFSEHMVLQTGQAAPIWGWADAGEEVKVSLAGQSMTTKAGVDGKWMVKLADLKTAATGQTMTVKGTNTITIS